MFKLVLEKAEEPEIKLPTSAGSWKKQELENAVDGGAWWATVHVFAKESDATE